MIVKLTTNLGTFDYPWIAPEVEKFTEGRTCEVEDDIGATLVKRGHGVVIEESGKSIEMRASKRGSNKPPASPEPSGV